MNTTLTPTMQHALDFARNHGGKLTRHPGGFWKDPGSTINRWSDTTFGTSTVEALVARGLMTYTAWQEGKSGTFPVEATITDKADP